MIKFVKVIRAAYTSFKRKIKAFDTTSTTRSTCVIVSVYLACVAFQILNFNPIGFAPQNRFSLISSVPLFAFVCVVVAFALVMRYSRIRTNFNLYVNKLTWMDKYHRKSVHRSLEGSAQGYRKRNIAIAGHAAHSQPLLPRLFLYRRKALFSINILGVTHRFNIGPDRSGHRHRP